VALLLYVTLDLCLPVVGGAFVFEASESVEGIQAARTRAPSVFVVTPRLPDAGPEPEMPDRGAGKPAAPPEQPPAGFRALSHRPRAGLSPPPSDDH